MNKYINTVIVAPMSTKGREYPTRVICKFRAKKEQIVPDQIRTVDKALLSEGLVELIRRHKRTFYQFFA
jgi:mRNA interferase MazF